MCDVTNLPNQGNCVYISLYDSVPAPVCPTPPTSSGGVITVHWNYTHTGGLELTRVIVTAYKGIQSNIQLDVPDGNLTDLSQMSLNIATFTAGFQYTFQVTAYNQLGSSTAQCDPVIHLIGISMSVCIVSACVSPIVNTCHFLQVSLKFLTHQLVYHILLVVLFSPYTHQHLVECRLTFFSSLSTLHRHPMV